MQISLKYSFAPAISQSTLRANRRRSPILLVVIDFSENDWIHRTLDIQQRAGNAANPRPTGILQ
jgi:hypothetical protein